MDERKCAREIPAGQATRVIQQVAIGTARQLECIFDIAAPEFRCGVSYSGSD